MDREIKFRVWASNDINPNGKMYYPTDAVEIGVGNRKKEGAFVLSQHGDLLLPDADILNCQGFVWARVSNNGLDVMQLTGSQDKDGKYLYEGDIIKRNKKKYLIYYVNSKFVAQQITGGIVKNVGKDLITYSFTCELIGNIYQHPELLK